MKNYYQEKYCNLCKTGEKPFEEVVKILLYQSAKPKLPDGRKWLFWQYTNKGKIEGIKTDVDLNAFAGTREEFDQLIKKD